MEIGNLILHVEALIFASEKPLTAIELTDILNAAFGFMDDKIVIDQVEAAVEGIYEKYKSEFYSFEIRQSGGGWQFLTKKEFHKTIAQINGDKFLKRLSAATLETLAIIAYKQPITKGEIEAIRGVNSDYSVQKLLEKELIIIAGRNEKMPGHPLIYNVSKSFMDYFGINSAEDLPKIREVLAEQMVEPTYINDEANYHTQEVPTPHLENETTVETTITDEETVTMVADAENEEAAIVTDAEETSEPSEEV
jgi:segregation and condensation protein B